MTTDERPRRCAQAAPEPLLVPARLHDPPPQLRARVAAYAARVTAADGRSGQPFLENPHPGAATGVETTVWGLLALRLVGARAEVERVRPRTLAALRAAYNPQLGIYEPTASQTSGGPGAWRLHNDAVTRLGFQLLGAPARPFPRGLERLRAFPWAPADASQALARLDQTWADDPRSAAKAAFQYLWLYTRLAGIGRLDDLDDAARRVLAWLEARRDPATGFIGMGPGVALGWAMRGHRNLALNLLWPLGVQERGVERLVDAVLACQRPDGLFHDGGACANMDAVHLLAAYARRTTHRRAQARSAARRCAAAMFDRLASPDGGFFFTLHERAAAPSRARTTNGLAFALLTLAYWQALDPAARRGLSQALAAARGA